ncbi:MAG: class I SAM-dependent methyltransferase [Oscillospiraceae bacterium]|nr:class I SAM-dependent methyltransferase [Oscillospiraceae bacterium]
MRIPKRLKAIAELIPRGSRLLDVGTDNALLPVWLILHGIINTAIAADISPKCIARAVETARVHCVPEQVRCVVSDGIKAIDGDVFDVAVIAGMGGESIRDILEASPDKIRGKLLILQPQTKQIELLDFLRSSGFDILSERVVCERGRTYLIQTVKLPQ